MIVGGLKLDEHEIAGANGGCQEENLHGRVVQRDEARSNGLIGNQPLCFHVRVSIVK